MHDVAILFVTAQEVGDNLAECFRENAFVDVFDCVVYILFRS
jgi:hypothetical protein